MIGIAPTLLLAALSLLAKIGGPAPTPRSAADPAALTTLAQQILHKVEAMRGQKLRKALSMGVKKKAEVTAFIQERLAEEYGPAKVAAEGRLLAIFGLIPDTLDYGGFITRLLTEQVAGFYDHTRQTLHIADWLPAEMQEAVMAHEIFHAIQDQEWGGGQLIDSKKYSHDRVLAGAALMEGDATIVMFNYAQSQTGGGVDLSTSGAMLSMVALAIPLQMSSPEYPVMASAPDYLKQSLVFPYQQGMLFIGALRQQGKSWEEIRQVYADPPQSTEQILHPERYTPNRDAPSEVKVSPLPGFQRTWEGTAGELHFRQVLQAWVEQLRALDAATGWDGDFTALEVAGDKAVVTVSSVWDTEQDATDYLAALNEAHQKRPAAGRPALASKLEGSRLYFTLSPDAALGQTTLAALPARTTITAR